MQLTFFLLFAAGALARQVNASPSYDFVYANVGPNLPGTDLAVGCLDPSGCDIVYSPPGCNCDSDCEGALHLTPTVLSQGNYSKYDIPTWAIGDIVCSTGQITATHKGSYELASTTQSGMTLAVTNFRGNSQVCYVVSLTEGTTNIIMKEDYVKQSEFNITGKYQTKTVSEVSTEQGGNSIFVTFEADAPIMIGCHTTSNQDHTMVQPICNEVLYGWTSRYVRGAHIDCYTLLPATDMPNCSASSDETATSQFTYYDDDTESDIFTGIFGFQQLGVEQRSYGKPSFECTSEEGQCMVVYSTADSKGTETTSWLPEKMFSSYFLITEDMTRSSLLSIVESVCTKNNQEWVTTAGTDKVKFALGGALKEGDVLQCSEPVLMVVQRADERERNLIGLLGLDAWDGSGCDLTPRPTVSPTTSPTATPTSSPTLAPTSSPTNSPTESPTKFPTRSPTKFPTENPTLSPTSSPTDSPTESPTPEPTRSPVTTPTGEPTTSPSLSPTKRPSNQPTNSPTKSPITSSPTILTEQPTSQPTSNAGGLGDDDSTLLIGAADIGITAGIAGCFLMSVLAIFVVRRRTNGNAGKGKDEEEESQVSFHSEEPTNRETVLTNNSGTSRSTLGGMVSAMIPRGPTKSLIARNTPKLNSMPEADSLEDVDFFGANDDMKMFDPTLDTSFEYDMGEIYKQVADRSVKNLDDML